MLKRKEMFSNLSSRHNVIDFFHVRHFLFIIFMFCFVLMLVCFLFFLSFSIIHSQFAFVVWSSSLVEQNHRGWVFSSFKFRFSFLTCAKNNLKFSNFNLSCRPPFRFWMCSLTNVNKSHSQLFAWYHLGWCTLIADLLLFTC